VRRHNLGTLLRHVHRSPEPISRADLTTLMGLNRSTIAGLVAQLEVLGIVQGEPAASRKGAGRPSPVVGPADDGPYVIAVDVGVDRLVVARVGLGGVIRQRASVRLAVEERPARVAAEVALLAREVVRYAPRSAPLIGVGVSVPGLVRRSDGLVRLAPNLEWHEVDFASIAQTQLGVDSAVQVANDADLGALAEHHRGVGVGVDDLVYISGSIGVGAGVIVGGSRLTGAAGYSGEIGHVSFNPRGRQCHCGNRGCWETEIGAYTIAAAIGCPVDQVAGLGEILDGYSGSTSQLLNVGAELGRGLAGIVNAFNPQMVVLGGYLRALFRLVGDQVEATLTEFALPAPLESLTLAVPGLGHDSVLHGAAEMAFAPLLDDPAGTIERAEHDAAALRAG
jgi:predicted NBD/HSP70 family sugar kinase